MYLYFDVNGNLKEIINYPIREGDDNVSKIYVYMEPSTNQVTEIDSEDYEDWEFENVPTEDKVSVYTLPTLFTTWEATFKITDSDVVITPNPLADSIDDSYIIKQIPYDKERDLKYFQYFKYYQFIAIDITTVITSHSGRVDCTVSLLNLEPLRNKKLDVVSFFIQNSVVVRDVQITTAQYEYLLAEIKSIKEGMVGDFVPYEGAESDVNLGNNELKAKELNIVNNNRRIYVDDNDLIIENGGGAIILNGDDPVYSGSKNSNSIVAVKSDLPSKAIISQFSTDSFTLSEGGNYIATDIALSGFISGSDMIVITWDNCFAICPVPVSGAGRVVAAMWNNNGEAQTIRLRYELKTDNTLLDISLQGGFTPPSNHTAYVICYKLITQ